MHFLREWQVFLAASFLIIFVDSAIDNLQERLVQARRLLTETHQNYRDIDHCSFHSQPINKRRNISEAAYIMLDQLILQQLLFQDCLQAHKKGYYKSGVYPLWLKRRYKYSLFYCDMDTVNGRSEERGWTVIQRRTNGKVDFQKKWAEYLNGFGNLSEEHWIGLENIYLLTQQRPYKHSVKYSESKPKLRIDFEDWEGVQMHVEYERFLIHEAKYRYEIHSLKRPFGAEMSLMIRYGLRPATFSTVDNDSTETKCPGRHRGGWWYSKECGYTNLNGIYPQNTTVIGNLWNHKSIYWYSWKYISDRNTPLRRVSMKVQY